MNRPAGMQKHKKHGPPGAKPTENDRKNVAHQGPNRRTKTWVKNLRVDPKNLTHEGQHRTKLKPENAQSVCPVKRRRRQTAHFRSQLGPGRVRSAARRCAVSRSRAHRGGDRGLQPHEGGGPAPRLSTRAHAPRTKCGALGGGAARSGPRFREPKTIQKQAPKTKTPNEKRDPSARAQVTRQKLPFFNLLFVRWDQRCCNAAGAGTPRW